MASVGYARFDRVENPLPASDRWIGGRAVFEEVQLTPGLEYALKFSKHARRVRHRAEREGDQGAVTGGVSQGEARAIEAHALDGYR